MSVSTTCHEQAMELNRLTSRLQELAQQKANATAQLKRHAGHANRKYKTTVDVAFVLYVLTQGDAACVEAYLESHVADLLGESIAAATLNIERRFVDMALPDLEHVQELQSHLFPKSVYKKAVQAKSEFRLVSWVKHQNVTNGVAPSTRLLCDEATRQQEETDSHNSGVPSAPDKSEAALVKWAQRFRHRWGLRLEKSHPHEAVPPAELHEKAVAKNAIPGHTLGFMISEAEPKRGPSGGPVFGSIHTNSTDMEFHFRNPFCVEESTFFPKFEALAVWTWWNSLENLVPPEKKQF